MDGGTGSADPSGTAGSPGQNGRNYVATLVRKVYQDIDKALSRTTSAGQVYSGHSGDQWVTGDVNWDGYELETLVDMVARPPTPTRWTGGAGAGAAVACGSRSSAAELSGR